MPNTYSVKVTRTVDGDTFFADLILNDFNMVITNQKFRFLGVNTPERGQVGYYEAKEYTAHTCDGKLLVIDLHGKDAFGRWLVNVFLEDGKSLNDELINLGLAVEFKH